MDDNFGPSPLNKIAPVIFGLAASYGLIYPSELLALKRAQLEAAIWREQSIAEIATIAGVTITEAVVFCASSEYSLELIKAAVQAGAKLDEEDIKRTMEQRTWKPLRDNMAFADIDFSQVTAPIEEKYTFIVITPTGDRIHVKAIDCCLDAGCLIFEDGEGITVAAYAPGHWVRVERAGDDQDS